MKQNINIEAEGNELILKNKAGDYVIIPKKYRLEVQGMIKDGCHGCIDELVETLPIMKDYAQDGSLLPDWDKIKFIINPKNWGVDDYSDKGSRGAAFAAARSQGKKEFIFNGKRFNTNYKGTPQQQLKETGITDDRLGVQGRLENRAYNTVKPSIYNDDKIGGNIKNFINNRNRFDLTEYSNLSKQLVEADKNNDSNKVKKLLERLNTYSNDYVGLDDPYSEDAWNIYLGKPQTKNTFNISNYTPTKSKETNINYYSLPEAFKEELYNLYSSNQIKEGANNEFSFENVFDEVSSRARVLGNFKVDKDKDERGEYISYYDKYDLSPKLPIVGKIEVSKYIGKPFEIYDRIYTKDYGDGKQKRMYYTDKELSELNVDKKDFDTLGLQRELSNRGYKLSKSTKQDGDFDGILGDETKNALLDYQTKNKPVMNNYAEGGPLITKDKKKITLEDRPYTAVQDNTYVAPKFVPREQLLEQKKKQQFVPREQPVLKADTRTDQERKIAQEYTESVLNPSISRQIGETLQKPLRWLADPVKVIGDVVSAIAPNSALAKDLPNTNAETFEHRKKQLNPYISNKEKINNTINEAIPLANWALLNTLPVEAVAGNMVKSGKNLIKPVSKVVGKTDDVVKSTVYNEGENKILDFFTPKNTKKASSEFTFENIPDRKFNTLDDFKTKYKSDYQVTTDKRTFKGEPLDATKTGKEESNYFTRNVDDKIEKHYNNEITLQKFKDYGGDEKSFQTLIDNINTPSKTVPRSLNNASGLLTDEGVSLAVHNKYLDSEEAMQTLFHEKGHQSKIVASTKEKSLLPNLWEDISKLSGYYRYTSADKGSIGMYMSHPSEIYSRIMELKYKANLKPYENFTKELLEKIGSVERDASGKITRMSGLMPSSYSKNEELWLKLINKAPVLIPAIGSGMYLQSQNQNKKEQ